jgi:hypothetical protein
VRTLQRLDLVIPGRSYRPRFADTKSSAWL